MSAAALSDLLPPHAVAVAAIASTRLSAINLFCIVVISFSYIIFSNLNTVY